eukprot:CAMPEP_0175954580 /NCGR_PEP_ID=MMETSP0108-20121206/32002_1 /TAXON_ID=195067 ORGANISM="Goniomonas pacifica, Strain CCMP1869" /NCGR_SAMPLE_ID=MMETSP0108 /ASSEMBLY_ACC=CAM_ASM_000204 /LENGTH=272 /DNA_ID=CAMNT_0017281301 /DNA_START=145 /DNA_END=963 /DNA_ORIENTATION=+
MGEVEEVEVPSDWTIDADLRDTVHALDGRPPSWALASLRFPYTATHKGGDGGAMYSGNNEAEACPSQNTYECCKCYGPCESKKSHQNCPTGKHRKACKGKHFCRFVPPSGGDLEEGNSTAVTNQLPNGDLPPMRRSNILERAVGWVANGYGYTGTYTFETCGSHDDNSCPSKRYVEVCNGLVAMAWRVNNESPDQATSIEIPCKNNKKVLKPGDALHLKGHWIMFRGWTEHGTMRIWQMGGIGWGKANEAYEEFKAGAIKYCARRKNIIEDM